MNPSLEDIKKLRMGLHALLVETNQHATGECPILLAACKNARDLLAEYPA